jgi:hypothetical protein
MLCKSNTFFNQDSLRKPTTPEHQRHESSGLWPGLETRRSWASLTR